MALIALTATHKTVGLELLARLQTHLQEIRVRLLPPGPALMGSVILSTCNRFEIYCETPNDHGTKTGFAYLMKSLGDSSGLPQSTVAAAFTKLSGADVPRHLFSVGAGLESAVLGEQQIGGQIRRALAEAEATGSTTSGLIQLFQAASRTAKAVSARTSLGTASRSMIAVALELAQDSCPGLDLTRSMALVLGTGAYAASTMALLKEKGCRNVLVYSWSGRGETFARTRGAANVTTKDLPSVIQSTDIIIGCSGSGSRLGAHSLKAKPGDDRTLVVIDLALTRDFDPDIAKLSGVHLITLDSIVQAAPAEHKAILDEARAVVRQGVKCFEAQQRSRENDWAVVALRDHAQRILMAEIRRLRTKELSAASSQDIEHALRRLIGQLLHIPSVRAREHAVAGRQDEYAAAVKVLFGLAAPLDEGGRTAPRLAQPTGESGSPYIDAQLADITAGAL